jgi:hypothetical protein
MLPSMHLTFWTYKSKRTSKDLAPIYLRINIEKKKTEMATGVYASPRQWNCRKGIIKENSGEAKIQNQTLLRLKESVLAACNELVSNKIPFRQNW